MSRPAASRWVDSLHSIGAILSLLLLVPACHHEEDEVPGTVLVIVLDGARFEETLKDGPSSATGTLPSEDFLPRVWESLLPQAVISQPAWNLTSTTTAPAHVTILDGRREPFANYPLEDGDAGPYRPDYPNLLELLRSREGGEAGRYAIVANTEFLAALDYGRYPGMGSAVGGSYQMLAEESGRPKQDLPVLEAVKKQLQARPTRFLLANLHQIDRAGHFGEHDEYLDDVRLVDEPLVELWDFVQEQPNYRDDTWMAVLADHGRHSNADTDPPWRHHGCSCNGCRELPFLLLGPGVRAGSAVESPVLLEDLAPTFGALLGLEVPWADGLVRDDLFEQPLGFPSRSGLAGLAVAGGLRAELRYLDDPDHRKELVVNGQRLSSSSAIEVAAPVLARQGEQAWLCFRELALRPDEERTPWVLRCFASDDGGESFTEIPAPEEEVGPYWSGTLLPWERGVLLAFGYQPNSLPFEGAQSNSGTVALELAYWDGYDWELDRLEGDFGFPTDSDLVPWGGGLLVAVGAGTLDERARYERDVLLADAQTGGVRFRGEPRWSELAGLLYDSPSAWRLEHPALWVEEDEDGEEVAAWLACNASGGGTAVDAALAATEDGGRSWTAARLLELPGSVLPSPGPTWLAGEPVFGVLDEAGQVELCRGGRELEPSCVPTGSPRLLALAADGDELHAILDAGTAEWEERSWSLEDFGAELLDSGLD